MAKKLELSWVGALRQWRKRRKVGDKTKTFYLGTGSGKGDRESYDRALAKWKAIELSLIPAPIVDEELDAFQAGVAVMRAIPVGGMSPTDPVAKYFGWDKPKPTGKKTKTLAELVDEYLVAQRRRMEHGEKFPNAPQGDRISPIRFISYRYNARLMATVWGTTGVPSSEAETFAAMKVYRDAQQDLLTAGTIGEATFNERIKTLRHCIGWAFDNYHITALPRNFKKLVSKHKVANSARALDVALVRKIWNAANGRLKTWIALACNCGLYSVDCSYLHCSEIQGDHLVLNRHKTGVPCRFKLWPVTRKLLEQHANKKGLAFTDESGKNLYQIDVSEMGGRKSKIDNQLMILKGNLGIKEVSFSNFRDTSSTKIESIDPTLTDIFDGHADGRMAKHYIDYDKLDKDTLFAKLDAATDELGTWYGFQLDD